ncbi:MAG TPA: hypothetical protein VHL77_10625 [Ferruginibacter sp.]|jgi:hypothetical protein|nr:hypothetical protein [Ferruginibacter sp.]
MEPQHWIPVVITIIYLVSRALKKSQGQQPSDVPNYKPDRQVNYDSTPPPQSTNKPKALTFEELLREITEAKQPKPPVFEPAQPKPAPAYVDYDDQVGEEEQDLEDVNYNYRKKDRLYADYEEAKRQAFLRPSLEETMSIKDTKVEFGKFKVFEQQQQRNLLEEYTKDFQDPEGFKKAVVMSEILNRKFSY